MGAHKIRMQMKRERENAQRRFRRQKQRNVLASPGIHDLIVVLDNLKPSYNIGKIFRSAQAFGVKEVHLVGIDFFDPAPGMGAFKAVPAIFHDDFDACYTMISARGYTPVILEPDKGGSLMDCPLPQKSAFVFGHEEFGISFDPADYKGVQRLAIPQYGAVQSLNVSVAASIVMYEYARQHGDHQGCSGSLTGRSQP